MYNINYYGLTFKAMGLEVKTPIYSSVPPHISGQGIDLDYSDVEWFALETN